MQQRIHPNYYNEIEITCACGHSIITGSTLEGPVRVEICSNCHPFWTGEKKLIDTEGRVQRFERQETHAQEYKEQVSEAKKKKQNRDDTNKKGKSQPLTLQELLSQSRK